MDLSEHSHEQAKKLVFCLQSMRLAEWMASLAPDDESKRIVAGMAFVYADAFFKRAPELKNEVRQALIQKKDRERLVAVKAIEARLQRAKNEFEQQRYVVARDEHMAHVDGDDLARVVESWNLINSTSIGYFIEECSTIYHELIQLGPSLSAYSESRDLGDSRLEARVKRLPGIATTTPSVGLDHRSWTRSNALVLVAGGESGTCFSQILSILNSLSYLDRLNVATAGYPEARLLVKAAGLLQTFNLLDHLYPSPPDREPRPGKCFLQLLEEINSPGAQVLRQAHLARDLETENRLHEIRNTIAAHVDQDANLTVKILVGRLKNLRWAAISRVWQAASRAFRQACLQDDIYSMLLRIQMGPISGVAAESTSAITRYD